MTKEKTSTPTYKVETAYNSGLETSNEIKTSKAPFDAVNLALDLDRKEHGEKIFDCGSAISTIYLDGEAMEPKVENIFRK